MINGYMKKRIVTVATPDKAREILHLM